jgi:hypothetical protein
MIATAVLCMAVGALASEKVEIRVECNRKPVSGALVAVYTKDRRIDEQRYEERKDLSMRTLMAIGLTDEKGVLAVPKMGDNLMVVAWKDGYKFSVDLDSDLSKGLKIRMRTVPRSRGGKRLYFVKDGQKVNLSDRDDYTVEAEIGRWSIVLRSVSEGVRFGRERTKEQEVREQGNIGYEERNFDLYGRRGTEHGSLLWVFRDEKFGGAVIEVK